MAAGAPVMAAGAPMMAAGAPVMAAGAPVMAAGAPVMAAAAGAPTSITTLTPAAVSQLLMNASALFEAKGMDWFAYYSRTGPIKFPFGSVKNWNTNDHGVNNAEGALRWPVREVA